MVRELIACGWIVSGPIVCGWIVLVNGPMVHGWIVSDAKVCVYS
jgi:hypothetical protein